MAAVRKFAKLLLALAVLGSASATFVWAMQKDQDTDTVAAMTAKMKTVCVGRFLIDLPQEAQVTLTQPSIDGFDVAAFDESNEEFQVRLAAREAEIKAKPDRLGGNQNLESVTEVKTDSGIVGKIFVHSRQVTEGTAANGLDLERYRYEGISIEALVNGNGVSIDLVADDYEPGLMKNLPQLVAKLVPNPTNTVPSEAGFCIDRAYFRDPLQADQNEQIVMHAGLPSRPDIRFMLILAAGIKPDEKGLLKRDAAAETRLSLIERMYVSKLRAGARVIGGLSGEEVARGFVKANGKTVYSFVWELNGTENNVLLPHLRFEMDTGESDNNPVPSALSEGAALGFWDKILSGVRLRPTDHGANAAGTASLPGRLYDVAGDNCYQGDWWRCDASSINERQLPVAPQLKSSVVAADSSWRR